MYSSISGIKNTHRKNVYNYANVDFPKEAIEEMFAKLHKISKDVSRLAPNRAVRAGGKEIIKKMQQNAPVDTGKLKKSISQRVRKYRASGNTTSIVGAKYKREKNDPGVYVYFNEYNRDARGTRHRPFMKKSFEEGSPRAKRAVINYVMDSFEQVSRLHRYRARKAMRKKMRKLN